MNKLPTKQIYLLVVIITGIIALSVYSTYAIFTFEGTTGNIVSIYTPNSLEISESISEYKQITVPKNSYITTDIDIYNTFDYEICFSIWYKYLTKNIDISKIKIYHLDNYISSGTITSMGSSRTKILIINDNELDIRINIGVSTAKNEGTCSLNISKDKSLITSSVSTYEEISKHLVNNVDKSTDIEEGYLTYKNLDTSINLTKDTLTLSDKFTYHDEIFTLDNPKEVSLKDIMNYQSNDTTKYYTCLDNATCNILYQINTITKEAKEETTEKEDIYKITNYDKLIGYLSGTNGIKKIDNNYLYYGDNPNNFISYNCQENKCELWRIIGSYYDSTNNEYYTKIIRNDSLGTSSYSIPSDTNTNIPNLEFSKSYIYDYLNNLYLPDDKTYLKEVTYKQDYLPSLELNLNQINYFPEEIKLFANIISLSDYINASSCTKNKISDYDKQCLNNNYLNFYDGPSWTNTRVYEEITEDNQEKVLDTNTNTKIYSVSSTIKASSQEEKLNIRPVLYLKSRMLITSGTGTMEDPYIVE